jgi:hypothetical protein
MKIEVKKQNSKCDKTQKKPKIKDDGPPQRPVNQTEA